VIEEPGGAHAKEKDGHRESQIDLGDSDHCVPGNRLGRLGLAPGCQWDSGGSDGGGHGNYNTYIDPDCTSVRLTHYAASARGWCEFDRSLAILPDFVRDRGLTLAIAEPWNGGSYGGEPGEACGECWEIETAWAREIVMVHDLCPIQGNPICAGSHFHFDLSSESAEALGAAGLDAASARRVPCPVTGNIHISISDWNQWGYMRAAFVNHRIPIRYASVRASPDGTWIPFERSGGAWQVMDGPRPEDGDGVLFRVESAQGQVVEGTRVLAFGEVQPGSARLVHDIGVQLDDQAPETGQCDYLPPGDVYRDGWGGIDQVRWQDNPWGGVRVSETSDGCHNGSASCLRLDGLGDWGGVHLYYWQGFPSETFATLTLWARTTTGTIEVRVGPGHEGDVCGEQSVTLDTTWAQLSFDLATACATLPILSAVTLSSGGDPVPVILDDIQFAPGL